MGKLTHGSLFSGIGGFDLAAQWMGWENKFHCEWNEFGKRVLNYYWPKAISYGDIAKTDFRKWRGQIDVLTGGFPCQPYSVAGKRLGKEDERHLWPHMLRAIREIKPKYVVGENVRGLISWNGGLVFDEVQADLEAEGYAVIPCVLPACGVNAPHRRERVWFVAYCECRGRKTMCGVQHKEPVGKMFSDNGERGTAPNTDNARNTASRSGSAADWTEDTIERELAQSEFDRYADVANSANTGIEDLRQSREDEIHGFGITSDADSQRHTSCGTSSEAEGFGGGNNGEQETWCQQTQRDNGLLRFQRNVANSSSLRLCECENPRSMGEGQSEICREGDKPTNATETSSSFRDAAYTESSGEQRKCEQQQREIQLNRRDNKNLRTYFEQFPTQPPICGGDDGLSRELDGITFPKWRSESIKAYGNAIVPAVAFEIFKAINEIDNFLNENSYLL